MKPINQPRMMNLESMATHANYRVRRLRIRNTTGVVSQALRLARFEMVSVTELQTNKESVPGRLRREIRNPSMLTVLIAIIAVLAIPTAILVPKWVSITQDSFEVRAAAGAQRESAIIGASALVSSHIVPWMLNEVQRLETAEDPAQWRLTSFTQGPCDSTNLSNLPVGTHSDAIARSCSELLQIQTDFSNDCVSATSCRVTDAALNRLSLVRHSLVDAFTGAGFVSDYQAYDERWTR